MCCHLSKDYLFLTLRTINGSSLIKLPALLLINKHSFQEVMLLKGLLLNKKLTFQRLTFMPNQECNHLTFKSFSIHVFCLHFYAKEVHFVRLPMSRMEQFQDLLSLCFILPVFIVSAPFFFSWFQWWEFATILADQLQKDFEVRQKPEDRYDPSVKCITFIIEITFRIQGSLPATSGKQKIAVTMQ